MENSKKDDIKCRFCVAAEAKYSCPRCMIQYCSTSCYKSDQHAFCSEQFFKECVEEELKLNVQDAHSKNQMLEILSRVHDQTQIEFSSDVDSDDGDSIPDLSERVQNIDLNDSDELWSRLTEQEKLEFNAILNSGEIAHLIPEYSPWWNKRYDKKVEEFEMFLNSIKEYEEVCPPLQALVPFSSLSKVEPSPCILWNIINVIGSYAFTVRRFIGDYYDAAAANTILTLSSNLTANENFDSEDTAIESVIYRANSDPFITCSVEEGKLIRDDVDKLLAGPKDTDVKFYLLAALSDVQQLLKNELLHKKKPSKKNSEFSKKYPVPALIVDKEKVKRSVKKLVFYMSWSNEFYNASMISSV